MYVCVCSLYMYLYILCICIYVYVCWSIPGIDPALGASAADALLRLLVVPTVAEKTCNSGPDGLGFRLQASVSRNGSA